MKKKSSFVALSEAGRLGLSLLPGEATTLCLLRSRWNELLGDYLGRRTAPEDFAGGRLTVKVLDPTCRRTVLVLLPDIEKRLAKAYPSVRSASLH